MLPTSPASLVTLVSPYFLKISITCKLSPNKMALFYGMLAYSIKLLRIETTYERPTVAAACAKGNPDS